MMPKRSRDAPAAPQDAQGASRDDLECLRCAPRASKSLPGMTRELPRATRHAKKPVEGARARAEATKIDGKSALGALTSSKFVWVARKTLSERCHVDFQQVSRIGRTSFRTAPVGKNKGSAVRAGNRHAATKNLKNRAKFDRKSSVEAAWGHSPVGFDGRGTSVEQLGATRGNSGWLRRPRSIGHAAQVDRLGQLDARDCQAR